MRKTVLNGGRVNGHLKNKTATWSLNFYRTNWYLKRFIEAYISFGMTAILQKNRFFKLCHFSNKGAYVDSFAVYSMLLHLQWIHLELMWTNSHYIYDFLSTYNI